MKNELNQKFLNKVRKQLENEGFSIEDFYVEQSSKIDTINKESQTFNSIDEDTIVLVISYAYNLSYYFKTELTMMEKSKESYAGIHITQKAETPQISVEYSPGDDYLSTHKISKVKMEDYFTMIRQWLSNLRKEIESTPLLRQINSHTEKLQKIEKIIDQQANNNGDLFFSKEEGNKLKDKLNQLEKILQKNLRKTDKGEELEKDQKQLHDEVELLKVQVEILNKKKWLVALSTKFINWMSRNPYDSAQISSTARELLPIEIKDSLAPFPEKEKVETLEQTDNKVKQ